VLEQAGVRPFPSTAYKPTSLGKPYIGFATRDEEVSMSRAFLLVLSVALAALIFAPVAAAQTDDRGMDDMGMNDMGMGIEAPTTT
jgi:hypothetical protein